LLGDLSARIKREEILAQGTLGCAEEEKEKKEEFFARRALGRMRKKVFLVFSSLSVAWRSQREDKKRRDSRAGDAGMR